MQPDDTTSYADVLQAVRIPVLPRSICKQVYAKHDYREAIMLCAGVSGKDWCNVRSRTNGRLGMR